MSQYVWVLTCDTPIGGYQGFVDAYDSQKSAQTARDILLNTPREQRTSNWPMGRHADMYHILCVIIDRPLTATG